MNKRYSIIELQKESMHFSAGHFTIFSATERENLHGHNYQVAASLYTWMEDNNLGLSFDYRFYKNKMRELCRRLHQTFLMPGLSPYLTWKEENGYLWFRFNDQQIPFLPSDVTIIPVTNISVEELSRWFVEALLEDKAQLEKHHIGKVVIKVFSGEGQSGSSSWSESGSGF